MKRWILPVHLFCTFALTGLIWLVQLVHYPSFRLVDPNQFGAFCEFHQFRITLVVGPLMVCEAATAMALIRDPHGMIPPAAAYWGAALLAVIWGSTALLQVPIHQQLLAGMDDLKVCELVATNWVRTAAWSIRSALLLWGLSCPSPGAPVLHEGLSND